MYNQEVNPEKCCSFDSVLHQFHQWMQHSYDMYNKHMAIVCTQATHKIYYITIWLAIHNKTIQIQVAIVS